MKFAKFTGRYVYGYVVAVAAFGLMPEGPWWRKVVAMVLLLFAADLFKKADKEIE